PQSTVETGRTDCRTAHDEEVLKMIEDTERTSPDLLTEVRALRDEVRGVRTAMRDPGADGRRR
ncbi:hypothetical protein, partial [Candidatus Darwinibacter acetoxidans]